MPVKPARSSYRDRTHEFLTVVERLKKSLSSSAPNAPTSSGSKQEGPPRSAVSIQSEFNKRASKIGYGIHQTSQKLLKLAKLAKQTSVFDDPTVEIQELTAVVKQDITALNSSVVDLQLLCNSRNKNGNMSSDMASHSTTVVDNLKNRLMNTTKEFKDVLTMRTENLKVHDNRRQLFSSTASKDATNPFIRQRPLASSSSASTSTASPPPWANSSTTSSQLFSGEFGCANVLTRKKQNGDPAAQPLMQQQMVPIQDSYVQSRAEALQNVESTIHELSNIFTQLATMVSQQGELAIRIDENMDGTLANVEGAQGALLKYLNGISSNRSKGLVPSFISMSVCIDAKARCGQCCLGVLAVLPNWLEGGTFSGSHDLVGVQHVKSKMHRVIKQLADFNFFQLQIYPLICTPEGE
ncbi:hypothetical protein ACLOJK_035265 [Asimina triloba]